MKKHQILKKLFYGSLYIFLFTTTISIAGPVINVDTAEVDAGIIQREENNEIKHIFKIKNSGDEILKISQVKPSCGCTVVKFDSIIPPGKSGNVLQNIKVDRLSDGEFTKHVTVMSNASNMETLKLYIRGKIVSVLTITPEALIMRPDSNKNYSDKVTITTKKDDMKILSIIYEDLNKDDKKWQNEPPLNIKYTLTRSDSSTTDKYYQYTLNISFTNKSKEELSGYFIIKTNHPKQQENIKIRAVIQTKS